MRTLKVIVMLALPYVAGMCIKIIFSLLQLIGRAKIEHEERIPKKERNVLFMYSHQKLREAIFLPAVVRTLEWILHPVTLGPWSTPDRDNFARALWGFWLAGGRAIKTPRKRRKDETRIQFARAKARARLKMLAVLRKGGRIFIAPEGGRTRSEKAIQLGKWVTSQNGHELRPIPATIGGLIAKSKSLIIPIWVEYPRSGWVRTRVKIGNPIRFDQGLSPTEIALRLQTAMLALADE